MKVPLQSERRRSSRPPSIDRHEPFHGQTNLRQILQTIVEKCLQILFTDVFLNVLEETRRIDLTRLSFCTNFFEELFAILVGNQTIFSEDKVILLDR